MNCSPILRARSEALDEGQEWLKGSRYLAGEAYYIIDRVSYEKD